MKDVLEYKGYHTKVQFDFSSMKLYGKIEGISDLVNFECSDMNQVEKEFQAAIDDYLEFCAEVGKEPDKEYKGTFNVRISPDLHKKLAVYASKNNMSLNKVVELAISDYINGVKSSMVDIKETLEIINTIVMHGQRTPIRSGPKINPNYEYGQEND